MVDAKFENYPDLMRQLGPQSLRVLSLLTFGCSNKEIACVLRISEASVKSHITRLLSVLRCCNRTQLALAAFCVRHNLDASSLIGRRRAPDDARTEAEYFVSSNVARNIRKESDVQLELNVGSLV